LQERVVQLELRNDEVQVLNGELRRQLMANASELASALVEATRQGRDSLVRSGDLVDGRYKVGRLLGTGAMGAVYEVRRLSDGARFAMKLILGTTSPLAVARLAREAQNALRVSHPHVIAVRDVGMTDEQELFVVMDLAEGSNLGRERDRFGEVDWGLPILRQVAEGLAAIHEAGVVHRDIKPSNIILTTAEDGQPWWARITDFGVSGTAALPERPVDSDTEPNLTRTGHVMGTPRYMAPEAFQDGSKIGPPADMFSFGVLAREVLGVETDPPMVPYGLALATLQEMPLVRVEEVCDELYMELARSLDACLAADPTKRPTARALAKVLEMALAAHPAKGAAQTSMFGVKAG
jgi:serine/threonine-protein kinase